MSTAVQVEPKRWVSPQSSEPWITNDSDCGSSSNRFLSNESTTDSIRPGRAASGVERESYISLARKEGVSQDELQKMQDALESMERRLALLNSAGTKG